MPDEDRSDRTLAWLEALTRADAKIVSFTCSPGGFLDEVVWADSVPIAHNRDRVRRRLTARIFSWGMRKGLREIARDGGNAAFQQTDECEKLAVQVALPGYQVASSVPWAAEWRGRSIFAGVEAGVASIENSTVVGRAGEDWLALRVDRKRLSFVHQPTTTWDLAGSVLAADGAQRPLFGGKTEGAVLTERDAITRLVWAYVSSARYFAAQSGLSPLFKKPQAVTVDDDVFDMCVAWEPPL